MEQQRLSRVDRACYQALLSMTEGSWRYVIKRSDRYGMWKVYGREPVIPGQSEDELLAILGL